MNYVRPKQLLGKNSNAKTIKGKIKKDWDTYTMYLLPFTQNSLGINLCPHASDGCAAACLVGSGHGGFQPKVIESRRNKTEFFIHDRAGFLNQLVEELTKINNNRKTDKIAIRLNTTSDIRFEKFKIKDNKNIFELFPELFFYDYTKNHLRFNQELPKNYHLTFSRSETNHDKAMELLRRGINVAMVFDVPPATFEGFEVIDGDETDLTFLQKKQVIVGLKYKKLTGKNSNNDLAFESGFAIRTREIVKLREVS